MYKYANPTAVAKVVAKFAPAAIIAVLAPDTIVSNSTIITVNTILNNCSIVCEFAVTFKLFLPLKYPLITLINVTKNIDGDSATKVYSASGICSHFVAICPAPKNKINEQANPINANVTKAILNTLCAPLLSPTANLSDTNLATAFGIPTDETVSSNAYIWNPLEYMALPLSPKPSLLVKYIFYVTPNTLIKICDSIKTNTPLMKLSFFSFFSFFIKSL